VKGNLLGELPDRRPALLLVLGFTLSALGIYGTIWLAGARLFGSSETHLEMWFAGGIVTLALFALDLLRTRAGCPLGPSWHRQTPKRYMDHHRATTAAFIWGLDTGLVFTTFRVSSLSWAALAVTALGLVPWWAGAVYALGFCAPLLVATLAVPARTDPTGKTDPEPTWLVQHLFDATDALRVSALCMLGLASTSCLAMVMWHSR
jgi:hypothetical protein